MELNVLAFRLCRTVTLRELQGVYWSDCASDGEALRTQTDVDGVEYLLKFMDTLGTESYSSVLDGLVRNSQGFLIFADGGDTKSFSDCEQLLDRIVGFKGRSSLPIVLLTVFDDKLQKTDLEVAREMALALGKIRRSTKERATFFFVGNAVGTPSLCSVCLHIIVFLLIFFCHFVCHFFFSLISQFKNLAPSVPRWS
jgi:hypothetical protein